MRVVSSALLAALVVLGAASQEWAVTVRDLVMLTQAGLSDEVLVALIESDGSKFELTADDILDLRRQGLSEQVIVAMLRAGRVARPAPARDGLPPPPLEVLQPAEQREPHTATAAPAPVVVNVTQQVEQRVETARQRVETIYVPVAVPVVTHPIPRRPPPEPVYWGWGGKRRPDTWDPAPTSAKPPAKPPSGGGGVL
jgi:hypothetical protein